jgi:tetratricopeptide (TPR) repeat protein
MNIGIQRFYFGIIGLLVGFIVGFFYANHYNKTATPTMPTAGVPGMSGQLPPNHPPIGPDEAEITKTVQAADSSQDSFEAQVTAAGSLYRAGKLEDALKYYERAGKLKPDDYNVLVQLGNVNFDLGDHHLEHQDAAQSNARFIEAGKWYERALAKNPSDVNVRTDYGLTYYKRQPKELDRAAAEYRKSLGVDPKHPQTLHNLTVTLMEKGDLNEAEATLRRLEQVVPDAPLIQTLRQEINNRRSKGG